jgi:hypothetical protein
MRLKNRDRAANVGPGMGDLEAGAPGSRGSKLWKKISQPATGMQSPGGATRCTRFHHQSSIATVAAAEQLSETCPTIPPQVAPLHRLLPFRISFRAIRIRDWRVPHRRATCFVAHNAGSDTEAQHENYRQTQWTIRGAHHGRLQTLKKKRSLRHLRSHLDLASSRRPARSFPLRVRRGSRLSPVSRHGQMRTMVSGTGPVRAHQIQHKHQDGVGDGWRRVQSCRHPLERTILALLPRSLGLGALPSRKPPAYRAFDSHRPTRGPPTSRPRLMASQRLDWS